MTGAKTESRVGEDQARERPLTIRRGDWLLVPNILSLARLLFAGPAVVIIAGSDGSVDDQIAALLLVISFITDGLDGILARALRQRSDLGKVLDPIIDKLVVLSVAAALTFTERDPSFPLAVLIGIFIRDTIVVIGAYMGLSRYRHLFTSRLLGKTGMAFVSAALLAQLLGRWLPEWLVVLLPWAAFALLMLSSVDYLLVYLSLRTQQKQEA
ncbi:MAG: putative CDP-diacylglycerol--glycerol-3-phosphate 3-phosphatidyl-transferase 1 [Calditrichaeota bacterium]|nr:putative CDP-diacylglycerol--glycerol-3-phosphate 3-phosphatidyl-transferase 1 [Calditrichota bacterium]